jgi:hypothetical protein
MDKENVSQEKIRSLAGLVVHKTGLLIRLCNKTLPEEEGRKNMHRRFVEREKLRKKAMASNFKRKINRIFGKKIFTGGGSYDNRNEE